MSDISGKTAIWRARWLWEILALVIGMAASIYAFYPGCQSGDPGFSWIEATSNHSTHYNNWHPPMIAFSWWFLNQLPFEFHPPYANLFLAMNLLYWCGLILAIRPWFDKKILWLVFFASAGFFPPAFAILSQNIKDSLMCAGLLGAYGGLLTAARTRSKTAFIFGVFCLFLALGYRHNAVFAVFPLALWAGFIACRNMPRWKKISAGIMIFATLLGAIWGTNTLLTSQSSYPIQMIYAYDLVGISAKTWHMYLPNLYNDYDKPSTLKNFWTAKKSDIRETPLKLENIEQLRTESVNSIYFYGPGKGLRFLDNAQDVHDLQQAWLNAIIQEPMAYITLRGTLFLQLIGLDGLYSWPYFCMEKQSEQLAPAGYHMPLLYMYIKDSWLLRGAPYMAIITILLIIARWKRSLFSEHLVALGSSAMLYALSYIVVNASPEFRYLYWLIPVTVIMALEMGFTALTRRK